MSDPIKEGDTIQFKGQEYVAANSDRCRSCELHDDCLLSVPDDIDCTDVIFLTPLNYIIKRLKRA